MLKYYSILILFNCHKKTFVSRYERHWKLWYSNWFPSRFHLISLSLIFTNDLLSCYSHPLSLSRFYCFPTSTYTRPKIPSHSLSKVFIIVVNNSRRETAFHRLQRVIVLQLIKTSSSSSFCFSSPRKYTAITVFIIISMNAVRMCVCRSATHNRWRKINILSLNTIFNEIEVIDLCIYDEEESSKKWKK